jgi:hypothetical protein
MKISKTTGKPLHCVENVVEQWLNDPKKRAAMKGRPFGLVFSEDRIGYNYLGNQIARRIGDTVYIIQGEIGRTHIMRDMRTAIWRHKDVKIQYYLGKDVDASSLAALLTVPYQAWSLMRPHENYFREKVAEVQEYRKNPMLFYQEFLEDQEERIAKIENFSGKKFEEIRLENWIPLAVRDFILTMQDLKNHIPTTEYGHFVRFILGYADKVKGRRHCKTFWTYFSDYEKFGPEIAALNIAAFDGAKQLAKSCK